MKIDQICIQNIQHYNLDYILLDNFATDWATAKNLKEALDPYHSVQDFIESNKALIIDAVNKAFNVNNKFLITGLKKFSKKDGINSHDDYTGEFLTPEGNIPYGKMPIKA